MNREKFDKLSILEQIDYINKELSEGKTITNTCKEIGIGRSTISDRFKKVGYKYCNESLIYKSIIEVVNDPTEDDTLILQKGDKITTDNAIIPESSNFVVGTDMEEKLNYFFNNYQNDLNKLNELYEWYLTSKNVNSKDVINLEKLEIADFDGELITRSFKIYKDVQQKFTKFCKRNNKYKVQDILSQAIIEFLDKYDL